MLPASGKNTEHPLKPLPPSSERLCWWPHLRLFLISRMVRWQIKCLPPHPEGRGRRRPHPQMQHKCCASPLCRDWWEDGQLCGHGGLGGATKGCLPGGQLVSHFSTAKTLSRTGPQSYPQSPFSPWKKCMCTHKLSLIDKLS